MTIVSKINNSNKNVSKINTNNKLHFYSPLRAVYFRIWGHAVAHCPEGAVAEGQSDHKSITTTFGREVYFVWYRSLFTTTFTTTKVDQSYDYIYL